MALGTLAPAAYQTVLDDAGHPISGALIWTYLAGTSTPTPTWTDVGLTTPNTNPIVADSAGRWNAYLSPGASYKFVFQDAGGGSIRVVDPVPSIPTSSANVDATGVAGEALTAGQVVYLSDGSGGKTAGWWYKADPANPSSCTTPQVGVAPSPIASGATGSIRLLGVVGGLSSLSIGTSYFVGAGGALTGAPAGLRRLIGVADSVSSIVVSPNPPLVKETLAWANDFRLSLATGTPVPTTDITGANATMVYLTPYTGNRLDVPDGSVTVNPIRYIASELSLAVPATTATMYDIFAYANGATPAIELLAWTNDTTRATAIVRNGGRWVKSGDATRLYLGSVRTGSVSGQSEDSVSKRYLWNLYNPVTRALSRIEATASWNYSVATWRQANASTSNQIEIVVGVAERTLTLGLTVYAQNSAGGQPVAVAIGQDSTTAPMGQLVGGYLATITGGVSYEVTAAAAVMPAVGRHFYAWLEQAVAGTTTTWIGTSAVAGLPIVSGLQGRFDG